MRDLVCQRCARVLVVDFWVLVEAETVPMFSTFSLTCSCGAKVRLRPVRPSSWVPPKLEEYRVTA